MTIRAVLQGLFAAAAVAALAWQGHPLLAQQGHPLSGTWSGDWGSSPTQRHQVTLVLNWDGKNVNGIMNPGPDSVPLSSVFLDVSNWTVRIDADGKDAGGKPVHISAEGRLDDLGSYHRTLAGTWTEGVTKGDFKVTRN